MMMMMIEQEEDSPLYVEDMMTLAGLTRLLG
jgi:hypothetical protein